MDATTRLMRLALPLALLALPLAFAGCSSLGAHSAKGSISDDSLSLAAADSQPTGAQSQFAVEYHFTKDKQKPQAIERPLTGALHVQEALEQTGALKKFRRCEIAIVRRLPNGMGHKIPVDYDRNVKRVTPEFDYALLPGDRLIVTEDTTTAFDDLFENSWLGPLGGKSGKGRTTTGGHFRLEG